MSLQLFYHVCERKDSAKCHNTIFCRLGYGEGGGLLDTRVCRASGIAIL
jgi:hypothetical protein